MSVMLQAFGGVSPDARALVHGPISPAEVRLGEKISALVRKNNTSEFQECRVWSLSPLGVELVADGSLAYFKIHEPIQITLRVGNHSSELAGVIVASNYEDRGVPLIGLRIHSQSTESWSGEERRTSKRWTCSPEYMPKGVAPSPFRFNDFLYFRVADVSTTGLRLITSLRNKVLIPGMTINSSISLPMVGYIEVPLCIENARIDSENGKDILVLGCSMKRPSRSALSALGDYIFQFGPDTSLAELKNNSFFVKKASNAIDYRFVRTKDEFMQVLELRRLAYIEANKIDNNAKPEDLTDIYDSRSRIVIGVYRGKVIATQRLIFNEIDDKMEHEQYVVLPDTFPRRDEICEITRVCTHPDFRGSDVLYGLFRHSALSIIQSQRRYVVGCATDSLLPLYQKIGLKVTDLSYSYSALNGIKHTVFIGDVQEAIKGQNVNPLAWNIVWKDLAQFLFEKTYMDISPVDKIRMGLYSMLDPVAKMAQKNFKKRRGK